MSIEGNILVVDDNINNLKTLEEFLTEAGHTVRCASNGPTALLLAHAWNPELILCDVRMPGMNGYELCQKFKQDSSLSQIPVIFLSAAGEIEDKLNGFRAGGVDYILKSFGIEEIQVRVKTHLEHFYLQRDLKAAYDSVERKVQERTIELQSALNLLRKSDERYRGLFDEVPVGLYRVTLSGKILNSNPAIAQILAIEDHDQIIGYNSSMFWPNTADREKLMIQLELNGMYDTETRLIRHDKKVIWVYNTAKAFKDDQGNILYIDGYIKDITERKLAENALRESEERYRHLLESVTGYVYTVDMRNGKCIGTRHGYGCAKITGYEAEQYANNQDLWISMVPEGDRYRVVEAVDVMLNKLTSVLIEHRIIHKDGIVRWVSATLVPHSDGSGSVVSYDGLITDITDRKLTEKALRESEDLFRQIAENIQETFFIYEKEGDKLLYISPVIASLFGLPLEIIYNDRTFIDKTVYPDDLPNVDFIHPDRFYSQPLNEEFRVTRPLDGTIRWVRLRSFLIHDNQGAVVRVAGLVADITDFKKSLEESFRQQQQLIQADKMASLGIMVSGVAHEINNPNNLVMFNSDLIGQIIKEIAPILDEYSSLNPDFSLAGLPFRETREQLDTLLSGVAMGAERICNIVASLKEFVRIDSGTMHQKVMINTVVKSALVIVGNLINKSTNRFDVAYAEHIPVVKGNIQQIEQVFINLLTNACQALPDRTHGISVRTAYDELKKQVLVTVVDEGIGISHENKNKLFDPFFTTKRDTGGTGLGLSVSCSIVAAHKGELIIGPQKGTGTTATIYLPEDTLEIPQ